MSTQDSGAIRAGADERATAVHSWRLAAAITGLFTLILVPFGIATTGVGATTLVGLALVFAVGFPLAGILLMVAKPVRRLGHLGGRVKRQSRPWRAAAGTAYTFATGEALRMTEPGWSRMHVITFALSGGLVLFIVFGVIGRFVGDPPVEDDPNDDRPPRYRPLG